MPQLAPPMCLYFHLVCFVLLALFFCACFLCVFVFLQRQAALRQQQALSAIKEEPTAEPGQKRTQNQQKKKKKNKGKKKK